MTSAANRDHVTSFLETTVRRSRTPGLQFVVVGRGTTLFEYHGGAADLATGSPIVSGTTMMAYSMSKTVTAAAILQLVDAKKIGLDDSVYRYIATPYGDAITIRQLLCHTSGIPNPIPLRWVHPMSSHAAFDEGAALQAVLSKHHTSPPCPPPSTPIPTSATGCSAVLSNR